MLYDHVGEYSGRGATFPDWGANDAQLLRDGLDQFLQEIAGVLRGLKTDFEIVAVDDGSKDRTAALLAEAKAG